MKVSTRAWILVCLLWVVGLLNYLDRQVVFSVLPPLQSELGMSNVQLGLLGSVFLAVYGICSPFAGFLSDRFSRRGIIFGSLLVWSGVTWWTAHATSASEMMWARGLMGVSEACYLPAALALIAAHHGERTRSRANSLHWTGLYVGVTLGGAGGGWVAEHYGWRAVFTLLGVAGVAYSLFIGLTLRWIPESAAQVARGDQKTPRLWPAFRELLSIPNFVRLGSTNAISSIGWWMVYTWLPLHLYEWFHMSLAEAGFTATIYLQGTSFAGAICGGWLADRWSRTNDRGRLLTQVLGLLLAGPALFVVGFTHSSPVLITCLLLTGFGRGFYEGNLMPVMCQFTRAELRATGYGIYNFASCVASGTMIALAGALKSTLGLGRAIEISALIVLTCGIYMMRVRFSRAVAKPEPVAVVPAS
jgi:MFS family permease